MKKFSISILLIAGSIAFNACQKPADIAASESTTNKVNFKKNIDKTITESFKIIDGIIHFKDADSFMYMDSMMHIKSAKEQVEFAERSGFISQLVANKNFLERLGKAKSEEEYDKIIDDNKDITKIYDGKVESIFDLTSAWAMNRQGMVSIGGRIHCFAKEKTVVGANTVEVRQNFLSIVAKNANAKQAQRPCDIYSNQAGNDPVNPSFSTRMIDLKVSLTQRFIATGYNQYGETGNAQWSCTVEGVALTKATFGGSWNSYETDNHLKVRYLAHVRYQDQRDPIQSINFYKSVDKPEMHGYGRGLLDSEILLTLPNANSSSYQYGWNYQASAKDDINNPVGRYYTTGVPNGVSLTCE